MDAAVGVFECVVDAAEDGGAYASYEAGAEAV